MMETLFLVYLFTTINYSQHEQRCGESTQGPVAHSVDVVELRTDYDSNGKVDEPQFGSNSYTTTYDGYQFYFLNQQNNNLFSANPTKYAPKYGCYCAYAMTGNDQACPDPPGYCLGPLCDGSVNGYDFFQYNGTTKLYCFLGQGAKNLFLQDMNGNIVSADNNWKLELQRLNKTYCFNTNMFKTSNC